MPNNYNHVYIYIRMSIYIYHNQYVYICMYQHACLFRNLLRTIELYRKVTKSFKTPNDHCHPCSGRVSGDRHCDESELSAN